MILQTYATCCINRRQKIIQIVMAEFVNLRCVFMSSIRKPYTQLIYLPAMKNLLKEDHFFNRYAATKERSPRFRAIVILLLLVFSFILIKGLMYNKINSPISKDDVPPKASPIITR